MGYKRIINLYIGFLLFLFFFTSLVSIGQVPVFTINTSHSSSVLCISFSPDGKYIVSGSWDNTIKIWDVNTGKVLRTLLGQTNRITSVSFSPSGKEIISASGSYAQNNTIKLWNVETGQEIRTFSGHSDPINSVAFSPDGKYIASGGDDKMIKAWNVETGENFRTLVGHSGNIGCVAFSPDGKYIVSGGAGYVDHSEDYTIKLWDIETTDNIRTFKGHTHIVSSVSFSPDGKYIVSGSWDKKIIQWDAETGKIIETLNCTEDISCISISPNGKLIVAVGYSLWPAIGFIELWDIETGQIINTISEPTTGVDHVSFNPDGKYFITGNRDNTIKLWDVETCQLVRTFGSNISAILDVDISPNNKYIASGSNLGLNLWQKEIGYLINTFNKKDEEIKNVCFSPDGKYVASGGKSVNIWNIETGKLKCSIETLYSPEDIVFSHSANYLLSAGGFKRKKQIRNHRDIIKNKDVVLSDIETGELARVFKGHKDKVGCIALSPDGKYLASGSDDHTIRVWSTETGKSIRKFRDKELDYGLYCLTFSPNGKQIVTGMHDIKIWDIDTSSVIKTFDEKISTLYSSIAFSPDGKYIVSGDTDNDIKLWSVNSGQIIRTFNGHTDGVNSVCFSDSGTYIISGSRDGTLKIWESSSGKLIITLISISDSTDYIVYTPEGRFDGTEEGMKQVHYVKGMEIIPLESFYNQFYTPNLLARVLKNEIFNDAPFNIASEMLLPPDVKIINPIKGEENNLFKKHSSGNLLATRENVNISYQIADRGGGISDIRIYQNGTLIENDPFIEVMDNITVKTTNINLIRNDKNIIRVTAYNEQGTEAIPQEIIIYYEGVKPTSDLYLFCIGINNYKNSGYNLNYAKTDAEAIISSIEKGSSRIFDSIHIDTLYNDHAVKSNILNTFSNISKKAQKEDVFIFYYSGHGAMSVPEEGEPSSFYLIPYDVTQITLNKILKEKGISAYELGEVTFNIKATKKLYILDACQSGGAVDDILAYTGKGIEEETAIIELARAQGLFVMAATSKDEQAIETGGTTKHGIFTYTLLHGLNEADINTDGKITVREIEMYLQKEYPKFTEKHKGFELYPIIRAGRSQMDFPIIIKTK